MCGIFSIINNILSPNELTQLYDAFMLGKSRGPENSILEKVYNKVLFGFHRLAINGLNETSNQPLYYNGVVLICNGEIYNYNDIISELNIQMTTQSDCEIIIHLYLKYGMEHTLELLDGVFAFNLLDLRNETPKLFAARDPFGVRPLFYYSNTKVSGFSSELKMIRGCETLLHTTFNISPILPGTFVEYNLLENAWTQICSPRYHTTNIVPYIYNYDDALESIRKSLIRAVRKRVNNTDRPIACLLSGGLDSSLICALVNNMYSTIDKKLETYSIGMEGSEDLKYARIVANHIKSKHTEIVVKQEDFLNAIPEVIRAIESYDTTTVRASVGNYLVSKYISTHSEAKVIFNGDGSDEVTGGYMYFHCAPDYYSFDAECKRLLKDIHYFDVLRSDRSISSNGLEARTPFLDKDFVQTFLSIIPAIRYHPLHRKCEKYLLRYAFDKTNLLPNCILWRTKEAFSDGVSSQKKSWYEIIQEHVKTMELPDLSLLEHMTPTTKEQTYYRHLFNTYYGNFHDEIIPYYWMPKFIEGATDSSARTLNIYKRTMDTNNVVLEENNVIDATENNEELNET